MESKKRHKSFIDEEEFLRRLRDKKGDDYELLHGYTTMREQALFKHTVCGHIWWKQPNCLLKAKGSLGCPNCQHRSKSKTTEQFRKELLDLREGAYMLADGEEYKNQKTKLTIIHVDCGTHFMSSPNNILQQGSCPNCRAHGGNPIKTTDKFKKDLYATRGAEYVLANGSEYQGANEKVKICHTTCGYTWDVRAAHILYRSGCPKCQLSAKEQFIYDYLTSIGAIFERSYTFPDCVNRKNLLFDFAILNENRELQMLVEYDGKQHFEPLGYLGGEVKFKKMCKNDQIKNDYCANNSIPLLRIPYTKTEDEIIALLSSVVKK